MLAPTARHAEGRTGARASKGKKTHEEWTVMSIESLLIIVVVGVVAGWLAGQLVKGSGFGLIGDLIVGVIGAFIGGWLLPRLGISIGAGILGAIISATIGAVILLVVLRLVRRA